MPDKTLVAYATLHGSTQEVAAKVADILRDKGLLVDLLPMKQVKSLDDYRAVVLGAPIYLGRWHKTARQFVEKHLSALAQTPVAVFALGPIGTSEEEMQASHGQLDKELAAYPDLSLVALAVFVGKYDPKRLRFPYNLLNLLPANPLRGKPASDHRDWDNIQAWAESLPEHLQPEAQ
jgi:menaquinone-dependent protoporphyrinogen oxidase